MVDRILKAAILALALLSPMPATAGGTFTFELTATGGEGRRFIDQVLSLYAAPRGPAYVDQHGTGNGAAIAQTGRGHRAVIAQRGDGHSGTVRQSGRGHRLGLFQFGTGTDVAVDQTGRRGSTLLFVRGW